MSGHNLRYQMDHENDFAAIDPGDGETIYVVDWLPYVLLKTGGAETRTLAAPTRVGSRVVLIFKDDGGDCTVTVTGGYNAAGATSLVFQDEGDWAELHAVDNDGTIEWRIVAKEGVASGAPDRGIVVSQGAPHESGTGAVTLTIANILTGVIHGTPDGAREYALPTGADVDAGVNMVAGDAFDWTVLNATASTHAITVAQGASGHTVVGGMVVPHASSGRFRTRKTAANTFVTYRIA